MNRIVLGICTVGLFLAVGQALQCYNCAGLASLCITTTTTCSSGEQCYSGSGMAAGFIPIKAKGCLATSQCNQVSGVDIFRNSSVYSINKTCCNTDLCNAAPRQASVTLLSLGLVTVTGALAAGAVV